MLVELEVPACPDTRYSTHDAALTSAVPVYMSSPKPRDLCPRDEANLAAPCPTPTTKILRLEKKQMHARAPLPGCALVARAHAASFHSDAPLSIPNRFATSKGLSKG